MATETPRHREGGSGWNHSCWLVPLLLLLVITRFWALDYQAFHHDESIHSKAIWDLTRQGSGIYNYDPVYHGPLFYHVGALFGSFLPDTDFTARFPFAFAGLLLVLAALPLRRVIGTPASLLLMALLIVSPTITYYSRFAREDVFMTALLAWTITGGILYIQTRRLRWLTLAWLSVILAYCNKENSYINGFMVCAFVVLAAAWLVWRRGSEGLRTVLLHYGPLTRLLILFGAFSAAVFLFVAIDARLGPQTPLLEGLSRILRHTVALSPDAVEPGAFEGSAGYFTAPGQERARTWFHLGAIGTTLLLLVLVEFLSVKLAGGKRGARWWRALAAFVGYGAAALWLSDFFRWAANHDGAHFLSGLREKLLAGALLLSTLCLLPYLPTLLSPEVRRRTGSGWTRWRTLIRLLRPRLVARWFLAAQVLLAIAIYSLFFSSFGTNVPEGLRAGLYDYIAYWFRQQTGEYRIWGVWWYYLPRLALYETMALVLVLAGGIWFLIRGRKSQPRSHTTLVLFAAWLAAGMIGVYAVLNEKVGWLAIYQAYAIALLAVLLAGPLLTQRHSWRSRLLGAAILLPAALFTCWQHFLAVHRLPDAPTEPMAFVTTSREYLEEMRRIEQLHWQAVGNQEEPPLIGLTGEGVWPAAWYLRRLRTTADPLAPGISILLLEDHPEIRRRMERMRDNRWELRSVIVRGWWFAHGEGLPAGRDLAGNLYALMTNRKNDHSHLFPEGSLLRENYATGFAVQVLRFALQRIPWYPATGSKVLFAWRTDEPSSFTGDEWLDGLERPPKEAPVVARLGGDGILNSPRALVVLPDGNLAVADSGNGRVVILNSEGHLVREVGSGILSGEVTGPCGLATDSEGRLYVADTWNHVIRLFSPEGELLASCAAIPMEGDAGTFYGPRGIAVGGEPGSELVYVADTGQNRVVVLDRNLQPLAAWGGAGSAPGALDEPVGIAVHQDGTVFVADTGNGRLQQFDPQGAPLDEYSIYYPQGMERLAAEPQLVLLPDSERLAMTYATRGVFVVIDPESRQAWPWRAEGVATEPSGIAFSPDWKLYVADRASSAILLLNDEEGTP